MRKFKFLGRDIEADLSVAKLIGVLIFVVIAMALLPVIVDAVDSGAENTTGTAATLIPLITVFYVIAILVGVIMWVVHETRGMGSN